MKKLLFLLPLLAIISCSDSNNPKDAKFNSSGCLVCDNYEVGESFRIGLNKYVVASRNDIESAIVEGGNLSRFCTSKILNMSSFFDGNSLFNQNISSWDVSNVQNMSYMFRGAADFNQDIGNWDVSSVTNMEAMFKDASSFNQDISSWDVGEVSDMDRMFYCPCEFDPISGFFTGGTAFNQDISSWCVTNIVSKPEFFAPNLDSSYFPVWGTCP